MKCKNCGAELAPGVAFCRECGAKVIKNVCFCRECGAKLEEGVKFCANCGASVTIMREQSDEPEKKRDDSPAAPTASETVSSKVSEIKAKFSIAGERMKNEYHKSSSNNRSGQNKNKSIVALAALAVLFLVLSLIMGNGGSKDETDTDGVLTANKAFDEIIPVVSATATIEPGTEYAYMSDAWNVYIARAVSSDVIKVESWDKTSQDDKKMSPRGDIGSFRISDEENGFSWVDDEHTAFTLVIQDKNNSRIRKPTAVIFTINISNSDIDKGTDYNNEIACYEYVYDDWHTYRAIPLTENLIKIECWYRGNSGFWVSHRFGWDVGVIDLKNTNTDFDWGDDKHSAFTITMNDSDNNSDWKEKKLTSFILENEGYKHSTALSFMGQSYDADEKLNDVRHQRNGFDSNTNKSYSLGQYTLEVPEYWASEEEIPDGVQLYAETGGKVAMLQISCSAVTDPNEDVSFERLMSDSDHMIKIIETETFKEVTDYEVIDTGLIKGILYRGNLQTEEIGGKGYWFVFPSENDHSWCTIICGNTDNTEYLYDEDLMQTIFSIKKDEILPADSESSNTSEEIITTENTEEEKKQSVILPESDTKLGKDFDMKGSETVCYINVDGVKNKPALKNWGSATVTDGVAEYLDYLKNQGCSVTITSYETNSPYPGYTMYETYFQVTNGNVKWDMYLCIQDEKYVEYEFDINLI